MKDLMEAMREEGRFSPPDAGGTGAGKPGGQPSHGPMDPPAACSGAPGASGAGLVQPEEDCCCCGSRPAPAAGPDERPGYAILPFVEAFVDGPAGRIPRVRTRLDGKDLLGAAGARIGIGRDDYRIAPGLYMTGNPDGAAPVLVSSNYKLSFDALRGQLSGISAWILVLDTRGVNVWCAAGKKTFSTDEVVRRARESGLDAVAPDAPLVIPQLAATGVALRQVKKRLGRKAVFGPIRAADLPRFLADGLTAGPDMRRVTFSFRERAVLTPVELYLARYTILWIALAIFAVSGLGAWGYSLSMAFGRGWPLFWAFLSGALGGIVGTPLLLPLLPGRALSAKGLWAGALAGLTSLAFYSPGLTYVEGLAALFLAMAAASFWAMHFTGATPYCSPSGVEKEMRRYMPIQACAALVSAILWIGAGFAR